MATWSGIRKKLETEYLAQSLQGHIQYYATSYSRSHDHEGRAAIRYDGKEIIKGCYWNNWAKADMFPQDEKYEKRMKVENAYMDDTAIKLGIFDQRCFYNAFAEFDNQDIEAIKTVYNGVLRDSANQFYDSKFDIAKLSNIKNDAIKSILSAKLLEAQNKGISVSVEIEEPVSNFRIELLDFITVLSILCDNAIEAAIETISPKLTVVFINNDDSLVLIVENSIKSEKVDVSHIFARGYSSKGEGRGLGLHNVNSVLEKYPKSTITTRSANHLFSQTIRFCKVSL